VAGIGFFSSPVGEYSATLREYCPNPLSMNILNFRLFPLTGALLALSIFPAFSQVAMPKIEEELVKFAKGEVAQQKTPQFTVQGVTEKRMKPKDWLEMEFELEAKQPKDSKTKLNFLDEVSIKYYAYLESSDPEKRRTLTADITYLNVPIGEKMHSVVYLSNSSIVNMTGSTTISKSQLSHWGAEAYVGGKLVGFISDTNNTWWTHEKAPKPEPGRLQAKGATPFAPLFFDYYLEEKAK
jgi:hypothetical protein